MGRSREEVQTQKKTEEQVKVKAGIRCPECDGKVYVLNSVPLPIVNKHGRYRECTECGVRFYTEETIKRITKQKPL